MAQPNIVFVFADQMRAQATGYAGDPNALTPVLDRLAGSCVNVTHAVSGHPVCCPYRASFLTGKYPQSHGVFVNDVPLGPQTNTIAQVLTEAGYDTGYIGKWHVYGSPDGKYGRRRAFIPQEHRQGFDYWKAFECNHNYMKSPYFQNDETTPRMWEGYDAVAQTRDACRYLADRSDVTRPFFLVLSWGTPHDPYQLMPEEVLARFRDRPISLRPNVPPAYASQAEKDLRGYYAHIAALDECVGMLLETLAANGLAENTIFVFTSDHGDMHGSQGLMRKHVPWDESIRVPFLLRWPAGLGNDPRSIPLPLDAPDLMPTLLGLCGITAPATVEGQNFSAVLRGDEDPDPEASAFLNVHVTYGILRAQGLPEYRGVRTARYTYVRSPRGLCLLYDNDDDPYQLHNRFNHPEYAEVQKRLEALLQQHLQKRGDEFLSGDTYLKRWDYTHYKEATGPVGGRRNPWQLLGKD